MLYATRNRILQALGLRIRRPIGVALLAVVTAGFGLVVAALGLWDIARSQPSLSGPPRALRLGPFEGLVNVVIGALFVVAGVGLWRMRIWAWWLAVLGSIVGLVLAYDSIPWMVAWAALLAYLILVRPAFRFRLFGRRLFRRRLALP